MKKWPIGLGENGFISFWHLLHLKEDVFQSEISLDYMRLLAVEEVDYYTQDRGGAFKKSDGIAQDLRLLSQLFEMDEKRYNYKIKRMWIWHSIPELF